MNPVDYQIVNYQMIDGHIEVTDEHGRFLFSADTMGEAHKELQEIKDKA